MTTFPNMMLEFLMKINVNVASRCFGRKKEKTYAVLVVSLKVERYQN